MEAIRKKCLIYERECVNCFECYYCGENPEKVCDNCGDCVQVPDWKEIRITEVLKDES